jgi:hypothetical protein
VNSCSSASSTNGRYTPIAAISTDIFPPSRSRANPRRSAGAWAFLVDRALGGVKGTKATNRVYSLKSVLLTALQPAWPLTYYASKGIDLPQVVRGAAMKLQKLLPECASWLEIWAVGS